MPKFVLLEVQQWTDWKKYRWTVEAESAEAALNLAADGDSRAKFQDEGSYGDPDGGDSGWAVLAEGEDEGEAWERAAGNLHEVWCRVSPYAEGHNPEGGKP